MPRHSGGGGVLGPVSLMAKCDHCHQDRDAWMVIVYGPGMAASLRVVCDACWDELPAAISLRRANGGPDSGLTDSHNLVEQNGPSGEAHGDGDPW